MPTSAGEQPSTRAPRCHQETEIASSKKRRKQETRQFPTYRKAHRGDAQTATNESEDTKKREDKLLGEVADCLKLCSRQRLRAVHMSMRQYGNEASRISSKDVIKSLQKNGVEIDEGLLKAMCERFEVRNGILQLESLLKYLMDAHSKTDRDSVVAERTRNTILPLCDFCQEDVDEDLIWRIQDLLVKSRKYLDVSALRDAFKERCSKDSTNMDVTMARQLCQEHDMPVYGALLTNLMKRCGAERSEKIDWQEFLAFLEKGQQSALKICPDLRQLSESDKKHTPIEPNILDELSSRTKSTLMSKLRKKASVKRQEASDVKDMDPVPAILKDKTTSDDGDKTELKTVSKDFNANAIRAEPNIEVNVNTYDQDTTESGEKGAQVIIDIIPPSKEPTLDSDDESEIIKTTEAIRENNETTNTIDDTKQMDEMHEIIQSEEERTDIDDDHKENVNKREEESTIVNITERTNGIATEVTMIFEMPTFTAIIEDKKDMKHVIETNDTNGAEDTSEVTVEDTEDKDSDLPEQKLRMQWVYGYRGNDCRNNIHVLASGEIIYFMSYVAVIYNKDMHTQRHYTEHTDEIKCIDVNSDGLTVATGQFASRKDANIQAHVRVWNAESLQTLKVLGIGEFQRAVACLAFSPGKNILAAVDNSAEKKLVVWDALSGVKQGEATLRTELICDIGICEKDPDTIIAIGKDHISWWKMDQEHKKLQKTAEPNYEDYPQAKFVICLTFTKEVNTITGDSNGSIYVWERTNHHISCFIKNAHDGPVFTLLRHKGYLLSGGRDGILHCWSLNENMETAGFLQLPETNGGIRMLQMFGPNLIIGTTMNSLHLVSLGDDSDKLPLNGAVIDAAPVTQCHYDDVQGLAVTQNATGYNVLTAGQDGIICAFDTTSCKTVSRKHMKGQQFICIDVDDTGHLVALGTKDGWVHIFHLHTPDQWEEIFSQKICKDRLSVIRISPDQKYIAAGSNDSHIYLLTSLSKTWEYDGILEGHQGVIITLNWLKSRAKETWFLRSSSSALEHTYWDPVTKATCMVQEDNIPEQRDTAAEVPWLRKVVNDEGIEIQAIDDNDVQNLVAIADANGCLHLGRNQPDDSSYSHKSPTSIRNLRFTSDGRHLLTVGGRDSCLIQLEIKL